MQLCCCICHTIYWISTQHIVGLAKRETTTWEDKYNKTTARFGLSPSYAVCTYIALSIPLFISVYEVHFVLFRLFRSEMMQVTFLLLAMEVNEFMRQLLLIYNNGNNNSNNNKNKNGNNSNNNGKTKHNKCQTDKRVRSQIFLTQTKTFFP